MFNITFLGALGGPIEGLTCALLVQPARTLASSGANGLPDPIPGSLLCVDGGLGLAALAEIVHHEQKTGKPYPRAFAMVADLAMKLTDYFEAPVITPFAKTTGSPFQVAERVFGDLDNYLVTHPHLDHVAGLVINSSGFDRARPKHLHGLDECMNAISTHLFNGVIWPDMAELGMVVMHGEAFGDEFVPYGGFYRVKMFELSHGVNYRLLAFLLSYSEDQLEGNHANGAAGVGYSSSFATATCAPSVAHGPTSNPVPVSDSRQPQTSPQSQALGHTTSTPLNTPNPLQNTTLAPNIDLSTSHMTHLLNGAAAKPTEKTGKSHSLLVFGDFELDEMLGLNCNSRIWHYVAPLVALGQLRGIVVECSHEHSLCDLQLFGHLKLDHLIGELLHLKREVAAVGGTLDGLHIIVNHIKEVYSDVRKQIQAELRAGFEREQLGVKLLIALSGILLQL